MIRLELPEAFPGPEAGIFMEGPHHATARVLGHEMQPLQFIDACANRCMSNAFRLHAPFDLREAEGILIVRDCLSKQHFHFVQRAEDGGGSFDFPRQRDGRHLDLTFMSPYIFIYFPQAVLRCQKTHWGGSRKSTPSH